MTKTYTPHVHAEVIKGWADGKPVEWRENPSADWRLIEKPSFVEDYEYRIEPEKVVDYAVVLSDGGPGVAFTSTIACLVGFYTENNYQGFLKRTMIDGKIISFEFISK